MWEHVNRTYLMVRSATREQVQQFPHDFFASLGYRAVCHGQKGWNGVAVLAREEPRVLQRGLPGQESFGARLIAVEVAGLSFTTVYCPNGKHLDKVQEAGKLEDLMEVVKDMLMSDEFSSIRRSHV